MNRTKKIPSYRLHKATGQAVVVLNGKYHYLGLHKSPESLENYKRTLGEWLQRGSIPVAASQPAPVASKPIGEDPSVNDLILG